MVAITAQNTLRLGQKENYLKLAKELVNESSKEEGCIFYYLCEDSNNPDILCYVEAWKSEEAVKKHNESPHFKNIVPQLAQYTADKEIRLFKKIF